MEIPKIKNLEIKEVKQDVLIAHQNKVPSDFSCCDGLIILPRKGRNSETVILDLNIQPKYSIELYKDIGPILNYVCTHGHLDHMAHVYGWEALEATIHAPNPEANYLLDLKNFHKDNFDARVSFSDVKKFAELNEYFSCNNVEAFEPGDTLKFDNLIIETIPFPGHGNGHVGIYLPSEKILHISCMGFDQPEPGIDGFGPWYGFQDCSIKQYLNDIKKAEKLFLEKAKFLTSSHGYIVKNPDKTAFEYMRRKIKERQNLINMAAIKSELSPNLEESINLLLEQDIIFQKKKMKSFLKKIYTFWEYWIIKQHLQQTYKTLKIEAED